METIGNRLFELRKSKNITQEKLSEQLAVSRQSVSNWELDKSLPDTDKLLMLAKLYEVSLDYIAYGTESDKAKAEDGASDKTGATTSASDKTGAPTSAEATATAGAEVSATATEEDEVRRPSPDFLLIPAMICTSILLCAVLFFLIGIMSHLTNSKVYTNTEIAVVDHIIEQYSLVEVSKLDEEGNYSKDRVWLDTRNLSEDEFIFAFTKPGDAYTMKFEYYSKTMLIPFAVLLLLIATDLLLIISFMRSKGCKARK